MNTQDPNTRYVPLGVQDYLRLDEKTETRTLTIHLLDPRRFLDVITPWLHAVRYLVWLLPVVMLAAGFIITYHSSDFISDMRYLYNLVQLWQHMLFSMFTIDLFSQTIYAATAHYFGCIVNEVTITVYFSFLPRIRARVNHADKLDRSQTMWVQSAPLLARFALMSFGTFLWYHARSFSTSLTYIGLGLFFICTVDLIFASGNPFAKGSCYKFLSALTREPNLRGDTFTVLFNLWEGRPNETGKSKALAIYGAAIIAYMFVLIYFIEGLVSSGLLKMNFGNAAIVITAVLVIHLFIATCNRVIKIKQADSRAQEYKRWQTRSIFKPGVQPAVVPKDEQRRGLRGWVRTAAIVFLIVLVLPYPYQPGGNISIYPSYKVELAPDVEGIVEAVYFDGGERVRKGTLIARLKADDNIAKLKTYEGLVQEQKEVVDNLKTLPKPEAIRVAEAEVQTAIEHEQYSREKLPRFETLYQQHAISFNQLDQLRKEHDADVEQVLHKRAQLALVKTGPTVDEIAAAESKLRSLEHERDGLKDKVDRASLYMPFDGLIATIHLKDKVNTYLARGDFFALIVDDSKMTAEIDVPEMDLGRVSVGQHIDARINSQPDHDASEIGGEVTTIDADVTLLKDQGRVVKTLAVFQNKDGRLASGMTGYAKIDSPYLPVWKAFTMSIVRYINIDVWSWIP